jgi:hypothetical protein
MADTRDDQTSNEVELVNSGGMSEEFMSGFGVITRMCKFDLSHVLAEKVLAKLNTYVRTYKILMSLNLGFCGHAHLYERLQEHSKGSILFLSTDLRAP